MLNFRDILLKLNPNSLCLHLYMITIKLKIYIQKLFINTNFYLYEIFKYFINFI